MKKEKIIEEFEMGTTPEWFVKAIKQAEPLDCDIYKDLVKLINILTP